MKFFVELQSIVSYPYLLDCCFHICDGSKSGGFQGYHRAEYRRRRLWQVEMLQSLLFLLKFRQFSWINDFCIVSRLWLIPGVLKTLILAFFFCQYVTCFHGEAYFRSYLLHHPRSTAYEKYFIVIKLSIHQEDIIKFIYLIRVPKHSKQNWKS